MSPGAPGHRGKSGREGPAAGAGVWGVCGCEETGAQGTHRPASSISGKVPWRNKATFSQKNTREVGAADLSRQNSCLTWFLKV